MISKSPLNERLTAETFDNGIHGSLFLGITTGRVVSTNDLQQMGRIYVHCPELGDPPNLRPEDFESLPPCTYLSPLAGATASETMRGSDEYQTSGPVPYGFWAIPKVGALVAVV